ncbi:unnamed protein product [Rotaria socialis]|uniref:Uncharacterized protein n=2 Tax=Rotaria socialis TaxID=392032 RepID=A0A818CG21_9BILA|nr:unnamed protein product [Rotaria socialis]CAF3433786.1 unnamed protein product [Rotaria socialis]CAF3482187.1 unnamed protein product [Rotaria socialis]CAF3585520.1 unnamed protein product [Rotaria socialis]CAF3611563.1 unnamed protein product [Rotaria socialis]
MLASVFLIFYLLSGLSFSQGYNCYECWSVLTPGCGEPFKPNATGVSILAAGAGQFCGAWRTTHDDGSEGISRNVVDTSWCSFGENACKTEKNQNVTDTMCCCSSELCNAHSFIPPHSFSFIVSYSISLINLSVFASFFF